jgi:hypothetical protein
MAHKSVDMGKENTALRKEINSTQRRLSVEGAKLQNNRALEKLLSIIAK